MGFLNRTGAEIEVINLIKNAKKSFFIIEKIKNTSSAQLWGLQPTDADDGNVEAVPATENDHGPCCGDKGQPVPGQ